LSTPIFHLLAGPNGAGKSTLYKALVQDQHISADLVFVNADLYERAHLQHISDPEARSEAARAWADQTRADKLGQGESFVSETVFSHESKLMLIQNALDHGFVVALYIVALDDPQRLITRVAQRVKEGGHAVPPERVLARYPRTLNNLIKAVRLASASYLFDAQDADQGGPVLVAVCEGEKVNVLSHSLPQWAQRVLGVK
jgi:predicted ABC-type ATPase